MQLKRQRVQRLGKCNTLLPTWNLQYSSRRRAQFFAVLPYFAERWGAAKSNWVGHPDLLFYLKSGLLNYFFDGTFSLFQGFFSSWWLLWCTWQCMIYMYVPAFFILLQSKKCSAYYHAIQQCICASDWKMEPKSVTCDFEQSLIKALKHQFPAAPAILCLFHWKQAIRRKLLSFHTPLHIIHQMIGKNGVMNILTVTPVNEIITKGIPYCRSKINETGHTAKLDKFWKYFVDTWMGNWLKCKSADTVTSRAKVGCEWLRNAEICKSNINWCTQEYAIFELLGP